MKPLESGMLDLGQSLKVRIAVCGLGLASVAAALCWASSLQHKPC